MFPDSKSSNDNGKMTRKEMVKNCSLCLNRKMDEERGLVCGLTGEYGDFDGSCRNFRADEREVERCLNKEHKFKTAAAVLGLIVFIIWIAPIFFMREWPFALKWTILTLCIAGTIAAFLSLARVLMIKRSESERKLTMQDVADAVRKEGYFPQKQDDNWILFKIQGNKYLVYYDSARFMIYIRFALSGEEDMAVMKEAAISVMDENFMAKILLLEEEDKSKVIQFSVGALVSSRTDFDRFFPHYLQMLYEAIEKHHEMYRRIMKERHPESSHPDRTGFPAASSKVMS